MIGWCQVNWYDSGLLWAQLHVVCPLYLCQNYVTAMIYNDLQQTVHRLTPLQLSPLSSYCFHCGATEQGRVLFSDGKMFVSVLSGHGRTSRLRSQPLGLINLLLVFASTAIPGFSLLEIHDQDFCSLLNIYMLRNWASSSMREGGRFV
jgi:hypothetical protein